MWMLLFASSMAWAMPEMKTRPGWIACKTDSDCIVAGDACRSCGQLQFINKKFKADFIQQDNDQRAKANTVRTCEACGTSHIKLSCVNNACTGSPKTSP